ncbi:MAG: lipoprotein-releasing ABC transporter permease subunit [Zetaproteobacteria bacterium]|nr:MAG: lipoprotein-releasing ABC transporter permease subunit [Zetaproteobacteria bacterium]
MLAKRYLRSRRNERFVSLIGWSSAIGIAIGVMTLIVVLSVMNGAAVEIRDKILGFASHIDVQGPGDRIGPWRDWLKTIRALPDVIRATPYVQSQVLLAYGAMARGALLKGIAPAEERDISGHIVEGRFLRGGDRFEVVIGKDLARKMGLTVGDRLRLMTPSAGIGPSGAVPRMRVFDVVGIFDSGFYEYDVGWVLTNIRAVQRLNRMGDAVSGIEVYVRDRDQAPAIARQLRALLPPGSWVMDWQHRHQSFFHALRTERLAMGVILSLIVLVAVFNMVSSLVMVVMERRREIAVLKTIGVGHASVMRVFMLMGGLLSGFGTAVGAVLGLLLAWRLDDLLRWLEQLLGIHFLSSDVYFIDHIPSVVEPSYVVAVVLASLCMGLLATFYPAWRAAGVPPADALRYE